MNKPDCSICRKTWAMSGKEPDCSRCITPLETSNEPILAAHNMARAIKNYGLESIFEVMRILQIKNKQVVLMGSIRLASEMQNVLEENK